MEYRNLGATGLKVSTFALGAMNFGSFGNPDPAQCALMVHKALDAGINTFDTADFYSLGESETILGAALGRARHDAVISTKCFWPMGQDPNQRGSSRRWIRRAAEDSLRRLGVECIDIYFLHKPDPNTALEESLGALEDLIQQGKVNVAGISTFPAHRIVEANWIARERGVARPWVEQSPYSLVTRGLEREVLPVCQQFDMGVMVVSPLNGGWLTGKYQTTSTDPDSRAKRWPKDPVWDEGRAPVVRKRAIVSDFIALAERAGITIQTLALRFALEHPAVSTVILGPRVPEQLHESLAADGPRLPAEILDAIDGLLPPGDDIDPLDRYERTPALTDASLRRRGTGSS